VKRRAPFAARLVLAATALLLISCSPAPVPPPPTRTPPPLPAATATAAATAAPRVTPTAAPTVAPRVPPTATVAADDLDAWETFETEAFSIRLPAGWQAIDPAAYDSASVVRAFAKDHPFLAGLAAQPDSLAAAEMLAIWPPRVGFADNLLIHRVALGAERGDLPATVDRVAAQLRLLGFAPGEARADLQTEAGLPLARIIYKFVPTAKGQPEVSGHQYLVLTEADLWILTYSAPAGATAALAARIEESARTFAPRS
jgi:hypothetical protein